MDPSHQPSLRSRYLGCLLGLAAGDAVGTTLEFRPRGSFPPLSDMVGGGPLRLQPGQWTDDTAMALCLAVSLVERNGFDAKDQMQRYLRWMREGYMSSHGTALDIGGAVRAALELFTKTGDPFSGSTDRFTAGNGCIMRLAPVVLFHYPDLDASLHYAAESARTTHGAAECVQASRLLAEVIFRALEGREKAAVLELPFHSRFTAPRMAAIAAGEYRSRERERIRGTGYVVQCLEAALWSFWRSDSFEEAILTAANLGEDADSTAAVCGQVAGAQYGMDAIPERWRRLLAVREVLEELAGRLKDRRSTTSYSRDS